MSRISRESIDEVRQANDIVEVVGQYVSLARRGTGHWACCPFHEENTPSFQVSAPRQTYKCFGCGEFGNVISFVMKLDHLDFREAVEKLAARAGVELRYEGGQGPSRAERNLRERAFEVLRVSAHWFRERLGEFAEPRVYLENRGLGGETAARWGLGYAPDEWQALGDFLRRRFRDDEAVLAAGVCKVSDTGRWYDFFRGRVIFPIHDTQGRVVGFGGRLLDPEAKAQKYLNSAEGPLYQKSRLLYAADRLATSKALKAAGRVLLMEGYTDVIAAHEAGFDNAVAPLGTSLTIEQAALLRRYGGKVTLVLDGDEAGIRAAERDVGVALEASLDALAAVLPEGMDPFDFLRRQGAEAFGRALESARDGFDFKLSLLRERFDLSRPVEAQAALTELVAVIARAENPGLRDLLARKSAAALGMGEQAVLAALAQAARGRSPAAREEARSPAPNHEGPPPPAVVIRRGYERELLRSLMDLPRMLPAAGEKIDPAAFSTPALGELFREMLNLWDDEGEVVAGNLYTHLSDAGRAELDCVLALRQGEPPAEDEAEVERFLAKEIARFGSPLDRSLTDRHSSEALQRLRREKGKRRAGQAG